MGGIAAHGPGWPVKEKTKAQELVRIIISNAWRWSGL